MSTPIRKLFKDFTGRAAQRTGKVRIAPARQVAVMGKVTKIEYETVHEGKPVLATHTFHAGSRPLLAAGVKPGQLYLIGNRFRFTARGIVDLGPDGRPIE